VERKLEINEGESGRQNTCHKMGPKFDRVNGKKA
jgi:hypothetical protein